MSLDIVTCDTCEATLSRPVSRLAVLPARRPNDGVGFEPTVEPGSWAIDPRPSYWKHDGSPAATLGCLVIHPSDAPDLGRHPRGRDSGCCGHDGFDGPNRVCPRCRAEVATLVDDCWTCVEIRFEPDAVRVQRSCA